MNEPVEKNMLNKKENKRKKILIASIDAGFAHRIHGQAIRSGIEKLYPGRYEVRVMDFAREVGSVRIDEFHKKSWSLLLRYPTVMNLAFYVADVFHRLGHKMEEVFGRKFIEDSIRFVREYKPDMIIGVHPHTIHVAVIIKKRMGLDIPVIGVDIEPFYCNSIYVIPGVDKYIVFSERIKRKLSKNGVPEEKIVIFDFIIKPIFTGKFDSVEATRKRLGIATDKLTVLMTSGGEGIGKIEKYIMATIKSNLDVQLLVITGRNTIMKEELSRIVIPEGSKTILKIFGFVEDMSGATHAADISFGKAGGCTTIEGLCMKKPMMYFKYVGENERQNIVFVEKNELGWYVPTARRYVQRLKEVIKNPGILNDIREKYEKLNIKSGTEEISRYIVSILNGWKPGGKI